MTRVGTTQGEDAVERSGALDAYVPSLVVEWLGDEPARRHRTLDCTLVLADISGFTRMTELLAGVGKRGAEEMADIVNGVFTPLLATADSLGGGFIKWGGDAVTLLFRGPGHASRGVRAALEMQAIMRSIGHLATSRGSLRVRMSVGVSTGRVDFFLLGPDDHRELLLLGPTATALTEMEAVADAGQVVASQRTADALLAAGERRPTQAVGGGWLLRRPPAALARGADAPARCEGLDLGVALSRAVREHILDEGLDPEHRHAAVGFVRCTGTDGLLANAGPEAVAAAADRVLRVVASAAEEHGVAVLGTDVVPDGFKVLLCAGAPRRLGHDEARMAATLRDAVAAAGPLAVGAGATAGRVFAGDYGSPTRRTYSLLGDSANLAARIMERAAPSEVLADAALVAALGGRFESDAGDAFVAKGRQGVVVPHRIGPPSGRPGAARRLPPLVGRDRELNVLLEAARGAVAGHGAVIEVVGEAGIGKTRLLAELERRVDVPVLWADGDVYAESRPYAPFERLFRIVLRASDGEPDLAERLRAVIAARAPDLSPWVPLIAVAAGLPVPSTPEVDAIDPTRRSERLLELTSDLLGRLLSTPTVWVFNDVHLMDGASRELIRRLAVDAGARPWLVLVTRRPDGPAVVEDGTARLVLDPLPDQAAASLLAAATRSAPPPPHRLLALARRAQGNPLFLSELAAELSAGGGIDSVPASVEDAIAARIDRLRGDRRRLLRAAAVIGTDVDVALLAGIAGRVGGEVPDAEPAGTLGELGEFVQASGEGMWRFNHQLIRDVAYEALAYRRRAGLHAAIADAMLARGRAHVEARADLVSRHLLEGRRYVEAWHYALLAAERARDRYAGIEAVTAYRRALLAAAHVPELDAGAVADVEEELGDLLVEIGEPESADQTLRRALRRRRSDPVAAARIALRLARLREFCGRYPAAFRWTTRAERLLDGEDGLEGRRLRARLAMRRGRLRYRQGRYAEAVGFAHAAIELARQVGDARTLAHALEHADLGALELGCPAGEGARRALAIYEEVGALFDAARVRNTLGVLAYHQGAWSEALDHYAAAAEAHHRSGREWDAAIAVANRAEILADQGHLREAGEHFERAIAVWRGCHAESAIAFGEYQLGRLAARLGDGPQARALLHRARDYFAGAGETSEVLIVEALIAESEVLAGTHAAALSHAEATLHRARTRARGTVPAVLPLLARVRGAALLALDRREEADAALREGLEAARRRGARHHVVFILRALLGAELWRDEAEAAVWREECARLAAALGLVAADSDRQLAPR